MNRICHLFGIKYPIIQGGMVWCSGWRLASAVSNAGGNLSTTTGIQFVIELKMKKGYTDVKCPVNVNVKFRNKDVV